MFGTYKHVGMEIRLRRRKMPVVDYPLTNNWKQSGESFWDAITSLIEALKYHSCREMMERIRHAGQAMRATSVHNEYHVLLGTD
jgi:hypothetical protein